MSDEEEQESRYSNTQLSSRTAEGRNAAVSESKLSEVEEDQTFRSTEEEDSASDDIDDDAEHSEDKGQLDEDIE